MPSFSKTSLDRLKTCHPDLQKVLLEVIKRRDCTVLCGFRGQEEQEEAVRLKRSTKHWPDSKHNQFPSLAVDVVPYPVDWNKRETIAHFAGYVMAIADELGIKLRWGGDWNGNHIAEDERNSDMPHFELA